MTLVPSLDYRVIQELLIANSCARALTVKILLDNNEFSQIVKLSFNPLDYNDVEIARRSLQCTELLRKHEDLPTNIDLSQVAFDGFFEAERSCDVTNERLLASHSHDELIFSVRQKIADILGSFVPDEFFELGGWGPGVTLTRRGEEATPTNKFRDYLEVTEPLGRFLKPILGAVYPHWQPSLVPYEGNRVITVPKNAKTDRVIAVEPSGNLWFQKAVGTMIRKRLRSHGVDLQDQTINRELCRLGSVHGRLATVDFSAASDSISYLSVLELIPFEWFKVLDLLRSPRGYVSETLIEYEKFSSMGNGFTFELESLIFFAIAKCVCQRDFSKPNGDFINIYGDDLIIPSRHIDACLDAFAFFGFKINASKSFSDSYYRESCGAHFWNGTDITPIYLRRYLSSNTEIYSFHNRVVELSRRTTEGLGRDKRFKPVIQLLIHSVPEKVRYAIPIGYGDGGFAVDLSDIILNRMRSPKFHKGYQVGWRTVNLSFKPKKRTEDDDAVRLFALYMTWKRGSGDGDIGIGNLIPIPRRGYYKRKILYVRDWPDLGFYLTSPYNQ